MSKKKNKIEPVKSGFYKLDASKSIVAEGYKSLLPLMLLLVSVFFRLILAGIVIGYIIDGTYDENADKLKVFYILVGILLVVSIALYIGYRMRNASIRNKILASDVTFATITELTVNRRERKDKDGKRHIKEYVIMKYVFYDRNGGIREGEFKRLYDGRAPKFSEGQQIAVAFGDGNQYILSKYTLLEDNGASIN